MIKAANSPLSQHSSIASVVHDDDLFDTVSTQSTTRSFSSPGYNRNPIYGRPPSSSGSACMGRKGRVPTKEPAPSFAMAYQQNSPVQSTISFPGSFVRTTDHMYMNDSASSQLTGYSLLATRLTERAPHGRGPSIRPLYRRFGALTHRLLLHLQDEIAQLEEHLHGVDDTGTHHRQVRPGMISPESRRIEESAWGEMYQQKAHLLSQIGFKLDLYSKDSQFLLKVIAF